MSHSTTLHFDGEDNERIIAIHNGDWSGPTLIRIISGGEVTSEVELPQAALERLVDARLAETVTEEERDAATRLLGIAKRRPVQGPG